MSKTQEKVQLNQRSHAKVNSYSSVWQSNLVLFSQPLAAFHLAFWPFFFRLEELKADEWKRVALIDASILLIN